MATYTTPGVYIEELPATGPIEGVGTSTAAFIGPAMRGPILEPTLVTSWTQFKNVFGDYISVPRTYLANAVEGFFKNGGTVAYIVRVGTARRAALNLADRAAGNALRVVASTEGTAGNLITVQVQDAQIVTTATALRAQAPMTSGANNVIRLTNPADATRFRPGDLVTVVGTAERALIDRVSGDELVLATNLLAAQPAGTVRIADLAPAQTSFRVAAIAGLETGSSIRITQGATTETAVVARVQAGFVTLSTGLANAYTMAAGDTAVGIQSHEFNLIVRVPSLPDQNFLNLTMDSRHSRYFARIVNSTSVSVQLATPPSAAAPPNNRPAVVAATLLAGGTADNIASISATDYTDGIDTLVPLLDVNMVAAPDRTDVDRATGADRALRESSAIASRSSTRRRRRRPSGAASVRDAARDRRVRARLRRALLPLDRDSGPAEPTGESAAGAALGPPGGHLRPHRQPARRPQGAGQRDASPGALGLERSLTDTDTAQLNIDGINVLRMFPNARGRRCGARARRRRPRRHRGATSTCAGCSSTSRSRSRRAFAGRCSSRTITALWQKLKRTIDGVPHPRVAQRRAVRRHRGPRPST